VTHILRPSNLKNRQNQYLQIKSFAQLHKTGHYVIPAKAGIQYYQALPGFRFSPE